MAFDHLLPFPLSRAVEIRVSPADENCAHGYDVLIGGQLVRAGVDV